jgi:hypothetical protein
VSVMWGLFDRGMFQLTFAVLPSSGMVTLVWSVLGGGWLLLVCVCVCVCVCVSRCCAGGEGDSLT